jgi:hypothetical protein
MTITLHRVVLALSLILSASAACADDLSVDVPCGPVAEMKDAASYRALTHDEWEAARVFFFMAKDTPAALPPGDSAMTREHEDGTASIVYLDGGDACAPMRVSKEGADILKQIKAGVVTHASGRM